jgi:DNA mismatch repair protein MutS
MNNKSMTKINNKEKDSGETNKITKYYFDLTKEYSEKYGEKTIVLLQVGAFFEVYALKDENGNITESQIEEFCNICQLNIADKKLTYGSKQVLMAGFRDYVLDKNLQKITDYGYTAVVYVQEKDEKNIKRVLHGIYSAGTYISCETECLPQLTNNIMCIWIDTYKPLDKNNQITFSKMRDTIIYGVSTVNIFTGKSTMFEYQTPFILNPTTFDELERYVSVFSPSEILLISPLDKKTNNTILQYSGVKTSSIHIFDSKDETNVNVLNCAKQKYIQHVLSNYYGEEILSICSEFQTNVMATQSFCFLLNFLQEHNTNLVRNISIPEFNNTADRMILANHTLKQLNIIDDLSIDSKKNGQLSSVLSLLNKCCSPLGRRMFQYQLLNPTTNIEWLQNEYSIIETMLLPENIQFIDMFRKNLTQIRDIEKICRQLVLLKLYPSSIFHLYKSIYIIKQINESLSVNNVICDYLCNDFDKQLLGVDGNLNSNQYIDTQSNKILQFLDTMLNIEDCKAINSLGTFEQNIIRKGVSKELDDLVNQQAEKIALFECIKLKLNLLMHNNGQNPDTEFVKTHETEKSGVSLQITKTRATTMKNIIKKILASNADFYIDIPELKTLFYLKDIKFSSASTSNEEIELPCLNKICKEMLLYKEKINVLMCETYMVILKQLEQDWFVVLEMLAKFIAKVDVLHCKSYIAKNYKYCKPEICETGSQKSFVNAHELRHCLIEHIQQNEIYVTNNISLGNNRDGMLLYGTNAVGKTSLIRALGIAIIMAQAGLYVPCSRFQYKPYNAIYSRILGNDNIFKGLSTFAVEMSELRIILKMADSNSLILGDELCSGTETESALSIFVAGLMNLHEKQSSFIFATHFHEIINYDEIKSLERISLNHMSVIYDREKDCLVYDRKIKDGAGTKTYGLEVCKSLYLNEDFLEQAYSIRNKYFPETRGELSQKTTIYNPNKIRGICELCKTEIAAETHHIVEQQTADNEGFIGHFHKNHKANLMAVCGNCHDKIHHDNSVEIKQRKKTTKGYDFV